MATPRTVETSEKLKASAVHIKDSAAHMERSTARVEDSADRRTELAADRTIFAAERTYAAWVRTGLVAMASGIGAKALMAGVLPGWLIIVTASALMLFSVFCFGAGLAPSLSWAAAAGARRGTHQSCIADFDERVLVNCIDCGADWYVVRRLTG